MLCGCITQLSADKAESPRSGAAGDAFRLRRAFRQGLGPPGTGEPRSVSPAFPPPSRPARQGSITPRGCSYRGLQPAPETAAKWPISPTAGRLCESPAHRSGLNESYERVNVSVRCGKGMGETLGFGRALLQYIRHSSLPLLQHYRLRDSPTTNR